MAGNGEHGGEDPGAQAPSALRGMAQLAQPHLRVAGWVAAGVAVSLAVGALSAASPFVDQQARLCRSILLVLNPAKARITVEASRIVGFDDGVTMTYEAEVPGERRRARRITCAFAKTRARGPELIAVSSDGRSLGPARITFLKRFWLASPDAAKAEAAIADKR